MTVVTVKAGEAVADCAGANSRDDAATRAGQTGQGGDDGAFRRIERRRGRRFCCKQVGRE